MNKTETEGMKRWLTDDVPPQKKGSKSDTFYSCNAKTIEQAHELFSEAVQNLFSVNKWHELAGSGAEFQLVNDQGMEIFTPPQKSDFIRISIPGIPGMPDGWGHEWVQIERIDYYKTSLLEATVMRVRPAIPPFSTTDRIAHFFSSEATSNFSVERLGKKITCAVRGRNELPNLNASGFGAKVRNFIVGMGAMIGLNKPQWKKLVKGIISHKPSEATIADSQLTP